MEAAIDAIGKLFASTGNPKAGQDRETAAERERQDLFPASMREDDTFIATHNLNQKRNANLCLFQPAFCKCRLTRAADPRG
jgi:hypothetical protein